VGLNIDPKRCAAEGCRGWRVRDSEWCAGHCPRTQAVAAEGRRLSRRGLRLPPLTSVDAAKLWLRKIGEAVAEGRIKVSLAGELRRIAKDFCEVDPGSAIADRLESVESALQRLTDKGEPWQG